MQIHVDIIQLFNFRDYDYVRSVPRIGRVRSVKYSNKKIYQKNVEISCKNVDGLFKILSTLFGDDVRQSGAIKV